MYTVTLFILLSVAIMIVLIERIVVRPIRLRLAEHAGAWAGRSPFLVDYAQGVFWLLSIMLILRLFVVQPIYIQTNDMQPELSRGDFTLLERYAYGLVSPVSGRSWWHWQEPKINDLVAAFDNKWLVRRVIALPGDEITQLHHVLYVNGEAVDGVTLPVDQKRADQYFIPAEQVLLVANTKAGVNLVPRTAIIGRISPAFW
ncbi:Signal peptidase I [Piscirickettsia salmonis]|uniref:signal peptidase I n=2 Tax=Piscirickettsia salmonis TaxID=1238 RepID=UPI0012B780E1|nr:Signal peptidase I [Piscirickettsia salmonis]QGP53581.1 Signal peptidase I [Piscirickettsia salmonis]QGP60503.1 Signal peptidase I [Piscirickettsia salmonis]QGP63152.1 Signal peptidase I [Piscirickettsia salmonis]